MAHNSSAITGIELEQFMDRLEAQQQEQETDALLAQLQAQPLQADSLASIDRLHTLWMQAGDSAAARAVIDQDGDALVQAAPEPARAELMMNLAILRLRVANYLDDEPTLIEVLGQLEQMATQTLDFNVEHYRRYRIFDDLERASCEIALKTIEVRYALTLGNPARAALRAWDAADQYQRRARVLAHHDRNEEARSAALEAVNAVRTAGPDQDIDEGDWLWLGNSLIEIIPLRLALFEQPIAQLTAGRSLPQRREWEVRTARLAARALHAQGDLAGALKICNAAALSLDSDGGNNFIEYELPWLMEAGRIDEAGFRAFIDVYDRQTELWPATARLVLDRLQDPDERSAWWPICVMRACITEEVLQSFLQALPSIETSESATTPLLAALSLAMEDLQAGDALYTEARAEAVRRAPDHPWITRLAAVHDAEHGLIDAATEASLLQNAIQAGRMQDNRSAFSLFAARINSLGIIEALKAPKPVLSCGKHAYNYALGIEDLAEAEADKLPSDARNQAYSLLREAQRDAYEQGQAHMERYFASGSGHPYDACAHLYSMLCNNLAINYRYYNPIRYEDAIELHTRGIAASPFAEHYNGLLSARISLEDLPGTIDAAEQLWHYSAEFGYSRHNPDEYVASVAYALYKLDRDNEILIWLERLLKWQEEQGVSDQQLDSSALFARIQVARYLAHAHPDNADSLWQRYQPAVLSLNEVSVMSASVDFLKARGRAAEAIDYCARTLALCAPDDDYDIRCRARIEQILSELQAPAQPAGKKKLVADMEVSADKRSPSYAPRNLLNADELKRGITQRSQQRRDEQAVQGWLLNHFYRHLAGNFEPARRIQSLDDACTALGSDSVPAWVSGYFERAAKAQSEDCAKALAPLVWVNPQDPHLLHQEAQLVEFLTSRKGTALEGKLDRITCPQALALWEREHAQMAARVDQGWRQSSAQALTVTLTCAEHTWVELRPQSPQLRAEMAFESYVMRHCLGQFADRRALTGGYGERYAEAVEQQSMRVFSLRDAQGHPHITLSLIIQDDGALTVEQVKGKQNRPPVERYFHDLLRFLNTLGTDQQTPADCIAIGIVRTEAGWLRIEEVSDPQTQTRLVARYPQLFRRLEAPSAMVEWLVAARQSDLLLEVAPQAPTVKYATRHIFKKTPLPPRQAEDPQYRTEGVPWSDMSPSLAEEISTWQNRSR